ncbi:MAG: transposase [Candidatus Omnitrophica bacterium]|nr:transposase [Candidatus Omnitrophota bacterium]
MIASRRVYYNGAVYYVTAQCQKGKRILSSEQAKGLFFDSLAKFKERFGFFLFAYVVLDDSVSIILQADERNNISKVMQAILLSFSKKYQHRFGYKGRVWQGRFESVLLNKEHEVVRYIRFIHFSPVLVEAARTPKEYKWSSAMFYGNGKVADKTGMPLIDRYIYG